MIAFLIIISIIVLTILILNRKKVVPKNATEIFLSGKTSRTGITLEELVKTRLAQGESKEKIEADLLKDLNAGGPIFSEFRKAVKTTTNGVTSKPLTDKQANWFQGDNTKYKWNAAVFDSCKDCLERHDQVKTWPEWEKIGLPRTGHTSCKNKCRCILLPAYD